MENRIKKYLNTPGTEKSVGAPLPPAGPQVQPTQVPMTELDFFTTAKVFGFTDMNGRIFYNLYGKTTELNDLLSSMVGKFMLLVENSLGVKPEVSSQKFVQDAKEWYEKAKKGEF